MSADPAARLLAFFGGRSRVWRAIEERWAAILLVVAVLVQATTIPRVLPPITPRTRPKMLDSVIFEYVGWSLTTGSRLYVDLWAIKPPLAFEIPAVLALLTGDNVLLYHATAVAVSSLAAVACAFLAGAIVAELTGDGVASLAAGLSLYALPAFHWRAAFGFKAKYVVIAFALLAVLLALRDRPLLAGAAAAGSVGTWQVAAAVPAVALGLCALRGRRALARAAAGFLAGSAVVLAPVVLLWNAVPAMVAETVLHPLIATEGGTIGDRLTLARILLGPAVPLVGVGLYGFARRVGADARTRWIALGAVWFGLVALLFDLDAYPDLFVVFAFLAVGIGLAAAGSRTRSRLVALLVAALAVVNLVTLGAIFFTLGPVPINEPYHLEDSTEMGPIEEPLFNRTDYATAFWHRVPSETCRPFASRTQLQVVAATNGSLADTRCGQFGPAWRAVLRKYG